MASSERARIAVPHGRRLEVAGTPLIFGLTGLKARHSPAWGNAPDFQPTNSTSPEAAKPPARHLRAFTVVEMCVILSLLAILALLFVAKDQQAKAKSARVKCMGNHKHVALAHRVFGNDHGDRFTMSLSTNEGGTLELVGTGSVISHYLNMTKELGAPQILICPDDRTRTMRREFLPLLSNTNVSFTVGLDSDETLPNSFLASDNHMTSSLPRVRGIAGLSTTNLAGWSQRLHDGVGNFALADGSVQRAASAKLWEQVTNALASTRSNTLRFEFP